MNSPLNLTVRLYSSIRTRLTERFKADLRKIKLIIIR